MMKFKALVFIRLRSQVDDSPGNAVRDACKRLSELNIRKLRLGKVFDVWLEAETREYAEKELECSLIDSLLIQLWKTGIMN